ncbi:protein yippee-like At5g53940 isoform X1 [Macadamia integrifolia]|uniref:protein yippee-like At5g53940 isoform X1 n=1 Tax=Macadamia integrifolia TaxID=60698 RepID=UPI001C529324|nr:protein yippee-like At5g53940 isoform X1 [Macadamia integrifolia]
MGRVFLVELDGRVYKCKFCRSHLALADDLVSKAFHCRRGKAYLFNTAVNIIIGAKEERMMLYGMHTVADVFCCCCGQIVGWKYDLVTGAMIGSGGVHSGLYLLDDDLALVSGQALQTSSTSPPISELL